MRLNPNIPWKTRGNAALSAQFGRGTGPRKLVAELPDGPVLGYAKGTAGTVTERHRLVERLWETVLASSRLGDRGTDPAMVVTQRPLPARLYWAAVRRVVSVAEVRRELSVARARVFHRGSPRGLIGAAASIAWPGSSPTWELIAYRRPERIGTIREVDPESVIEVARATKELFLSSDPTTRRLMVTPHTDCPILLGLRATRRAVLPGAFRRVRSEPAERWVIFRTNQGSGDHLSDGGFDAIGPFGSGRVECVVRSDPFVAVGGHVRLELEDRSGTVRTGLAFEPTKTLPAVARSLRRGDRIRAWGGRARDATFRIEGLELSELVERRRAAPNPRCPACHRAAGSLGRGRGFRCPGCRRSFPPEARGVQRIAPLFPPGVYHPTPSARRHLAPLGPELPGRHVSDL